MALTIIGLPRSKASSNWSPSGPTYTSVVYRHDSKAALLPEESIIGLKSLRADLVLKFWMRFSALFDGDAGSGA